MAGVAVVQHGVRSRPAGRCAGRGIWIATLLWWSGTAGAVAQQWPAGDPACIRLCLSADDPRTLGEPFQNRIRKQVTDVLRLLVGARLQLSAQPLPALEQWLRTHPLEQLTRAVCHACGCPDTEKTLLLTVRYSAGTYSLAAVEYDPQFDERGPVLRRQVVQRELVPDTLARLAARSWCPVGQVVAASTGRYEIRFAGLGRLQHGPAWAALKPQQVLQLCRQVWTADGIEPQTSTDQFLLVDQLDDQRVLARPADPQDRASWLAQLQDPRVRYLVRRVDGEPEPVTVEVRLLDSYQPREGCEVYLAPPPPAAKKPPQRLGVTDCNGQLTFLPTTGPLLEIAVHYHDLVATKRFAIGVSTTPLLFLVPDRSGERLDFQMALNQVLDQKRNKVIHIRALQDQLQAAQAAADASQAAELIRQLQQEFRLDDLRYATQTIARLAATKNVDVKPLVDRVYQELDDLQKQYDAAQYQKIDRITRSKQLKHQIDGASQTGDWAAAQQLLEEFCRLNPEDQPSRAQLERLRRARQPKTAAVEQARTVVWRALGTTRSDDLLLRWDELQPALETLLQADDRLPLYNVAPEYERWAELLADEIRQLQARTAGGPLRDPDEAHRLETRRRQIVRVSDDLANLMKRTEAALRAGLFPDATSPPKPAGTMLRAVIPGGPP